SLAQRNSPLMKAAQADLASYQSLLSQANSGRFPRFEVTGFFAPLPQKRVGTDGSNWLKDWDWSSLSPLVTAQLSFSQVLWTFGKIDALRAAAKAGIDIGRATTQVAKMELHYRISQAWWGVVLAKEMTQIISKGSVQLQRQRARLERERDQAEDEDKPFDETRLLRLRLAEADLQTKVRQAKRAAALATDTLKATLNLSQLAKVTPKSSRIEALDLKLLPIAAYERLAVENHPKLLALRRGTVARYHQLQYQKRRMWPDLVLTGRLAYTYAPSVTTGDESLADNPTNPTQSGAGIGLRWRLDVFRQLARIDTAKAKARKARSLAKVEELKIRVAARELARQTKDAQELLVVYEKAMRAARGWMSSESQMAKGGFSDYRDLLNSMEQYYRRKIAWLEGIYRFNVQVAALSRAVGVDVIQLRVPSSDNK
ncbi:MAG: hypothetical protein CMH53_01455, partial [Myxococcales bacterium]|nr:hypothetical protein [Myxococcales bacterium]